MAHARRANGLIYAHPLEDHTRQQIPEAPPQKKGGKALDRGAAS